jgi:hypothetical protein
VGFLLLLSFFFFSHRYGLLSLINKPKRAWVFGNMSTVLTTPNGWKVVIYSNDHRPPHVHVNGKNQSARFQLLCDLGRVMLMSNHGFTLSQINSISLFLTRHIAKLCGEWGRIHGHC